MLTVLPLFNGWRVVIYPNDHRPPHVHVIGPGAQARFELLCDLGQVRLMSTMGFHLSQLRLLEQHLVKHLPHLCHQWGKIHDR